MYRRGNLLLAVNPSGEALEVKAPVGDRKPLFTLGRAEIAGDVLALGAQSFVALK